MNVKIPKIDFKDISKSLDILDKAAIPKLEIPSGMPNPKDVAINVLEKLPKRNSFSIVDVIPKEFFDKIDTEQMVGDINEKINSVSDTIGLIKGLNISDDMTTNINNIMNNGSFMSLYKAPSVPNTSAVGSDFSINEMITEGNAMADIVNNDFDINKYLKEFDKISL